MCWKTCATTLPSCSKATNEVNFVAQKFMRVAIGTNNIDTNSRLCMSSSVAGHKRAFGEDLVPGCYEDFELADLIVLVGSNTAWCHPTLFQRILRAREARPLSGGPSEHKRRRQRGAPGPRCRAAMHW